LARRKRLTKAQRRRRNRWVSGIIISLLIFVIGYFTGRRDVDFSQIRGTLDEATQRIEQGIENFEIPSFREEAPAPVENTTQMHMLDVGQGSAILLIAQDGTTILIDTGRYDDSEKRIISYLDEAIGLGGTIDLLIFTHNDADHIGNGDLVLEYFDVKEVWMNGVDHTTRVYEDLLDALLASDAEYKEPKAGDIFERGNFVIEVLHPVADSGGTDNNDESIVTRLSFDGMSLMTSGDVSVTQENQIVDRSGPLLSDILVLGHHGANTSTSEKWLQAVKPQMAFYQAGEDNTYGHPHPEVIERVEQYEIPVYGTDELGTISIFVDENGAVNVETEK